MGQSGFAHQYSVKCYDNLKNRLCHIEPMIDKPTSEEIKANRLRLRTSIDVVRFLAFQACPFRGHDESDSSKNQGNFFEMVKLLASYDEVKVVVLGNAPQNAKYTSPQIQIDESRDELRREQMALVIRFVDKDGFIRERFLTLFMFMTHTLPHLNKKYALFYQQLNWMFKIFMDKDTMVLAIGVEIGMDYRQSSWMNALTHIMFISLLISYS
jgi:hypothetical protein